MTTEANAAPDAQPSPVDQAPAAQPQPAPAPAPQAEVPTNTQVLPDGLAALAEHAKQAAQAEAPKAPDAPQEFKDLQSMLGEELSQDPTASLALNFLEVLCSDKVDINRAFARAAEEGDARFIDVRYLTEVLGEKGAKQAVDAANRIIYAAEQKGEALKQELVKDVPGGGAALEQASAAFNQHADPNTKAAIARLLDSGDVPSMKFAVQQIMNFAQANGKVVIHNDQPMGQPGSLQGISREEFAKALQKPGLQDGSPEYTRLLEQRKLGMRQGL